MTLDAGHTVGSLIVGIWAMKWGTWRVQAHNPIIGSLSLLVGSVGIRAYVLEILGL